MAEAKIIIARKVMGNPEYDRSEGHRYEMAGQ